MAAFDEHKRSVYKLQVSYEDGDMEWGTFSNGGSLFLTEEGDHRRVGWLDEASQSSGARPSGPAAEGGAEKKGKRGRPRKNPRPEEKQQQQEAPDKPKRGRPRKQPQQPAAPLDPDKMLESFHWVEDTPVETDQKQEQQGDGGPSSAVAPAAAPSAASTAAGAANGSRKAPKVPIKWSPEAAAAAASTSFSARVSAHQFERPQRGAKAQARESMRQQLAAEEEESPQKQLQQQPQANGGGPGPLSPLSQERRPPGGGTAAPGASGGCASTAAVTPTQEEQNGRDGTPLSRDQQQQKRGREAEVTPDSTPGKKARQGDMEAAETLKSLSQTAWDPKCVPHPEVLAQRQRSAEHQQRQQQELKKQQEEEEEHVKQQQQHVKKQQQKKQEEEQKQQQQKKQEEHEEEHVKTQQQEEQQQRKQNGEEQKQPLLKGGSSVIVSSREPQERPKKRRPSETGAEGSREVEEASLSKGPQEQEPVPQPAKPAGSRKLKTSCKSMVLVRDLRPRPLVPLPACPKFVSLPPILSSTPPFSPLSSPPSFCSPSSFPAPALSPSSLSLSSPAPPSSLLPCLSHPFLTSDPLFNSPLLQLSSTLPNL